MSLDRHPTLNRMRKRDRPLATRHASIIFLALFLSSTATTPAWAQIFEPLEGSISSIYQSQFGGDHLDSFGNVDNFGPMRASVLSLNFTFALTDRLAVNANIPFVLSKFTSTPGRMLNAHDLEAKLDDGSYHGTFQDFRAGVRYNIVPAPVEFTPFFELVLPTHAYETFGHAAPGKRLKEGRVGTNVGRWMGNAHFDLQLTYSFVESLSDLNLDHTNADLEIAYLLSRKVIVRAFGGVQKTLGGLEAPVRPANPNFEIHDRALRTHYSRAGGGASFALRRDVDVFGTYTGILSAKNSHAFASVVVGITKTFSLNRF